MACRAAPGPLVESVDPGVVFDDESAQLAIRGAFQVPVEASLDNPPASTLEAYEVELSTSGQLVTSVPAAFTDWRTLAALLPAGMPQGTYRVRVIDPWGKDAALESALVVVARSGAQLDQDAGRLPPLAQLYVAPPLGDVNTLFQFDAGGSTDTRTPLELLEVSWGFEGTDGGVEWTPWTLDKGATSQLLAGEQTVLLRIRDEDGDVGYAARNLFVAADTSPICIVTTAAAIDDGAQDCATSLGSDGVLSLDEAVRLAPVLNAQLIGFNVPGSAALSGPALKITAPVSLAGIPNLTLERELIIQSPGTVRISGLMVNTKNGRLRVETGATLELSDSELSDADPIHVIGDMTVTRTLFRNCQNPCIDLNGDFGSVQVSQSSFTAGATSAIAIDVDHCQIGPEPAVDLVGNVFLGFPTAMRIRSNCQGATRIVHQTFHSNGVAISYEGGTNHVLLNNVFSAQTGAAILGCQLVNAFANRRDHVLYGNAADGCLADDPGVVRVNPLFASPDGADLRLLGGSPLIDAAPQIVVDGGVVDVNGAAPGAYFGLGPDFGGRETF